MKKKSFTRLMSVILAATMAVGMTACGNGSAASQVDSSESNGVASESTDAPAETSSEAAEEEGITFPLEEEMTFDIIISTSSNEDVNELLEKNAFWQDMYEATNVKINFVQIARDGFMGTLNAMFAAGQEGDAILGGGLISESDLSTMVDSELLMPLNEFVENPDIMPNFNERVLGESPQTKGVITTADGNIYALPRYTALEGDYLESPMWINKAWVEQLGKELPATLEELEEILIAFRDNDMNGNGKTDDEIPWIFLNGTGSTHLEALLGLWGIPTKDGTYENYTYVENGQVKFAPITDAYKDAIKVINHWYEEGLIWSECFTGTSETFYAKLSGELPLVGLYTDKTPPTTNSEDYVQITPVKVEGYDAKWYVHPGLMGVKGQFSVTRSCENADVLMKWMDLWYSYEKSLRIYYGEEVDGRYEVADGKANFFTLSQEQTEELKETAPTLRECISVNLPWAFTAEDYAERMTMSDVEAKKQQSYDLYREYLNDEIWPRPYLAAEDTSRISELRTDIFNTVNGKKAEWVTGVSDIDAEWDAYVESLYDMGIEEFIGIYQETYDRYMEAQK